MVFYVDAQDTSGSTTAITPTERFRIHSDLKEQFRQHTSDKGYSISNYLNNLIKSEVSNL